LKIQKPQSGRRFMNLVRKIHEVAKGKRSTVMKLLNSRKTIHGQRRRITRKHLISEQKPKATCAQLDVPPCQVGLEES
jgi:hypothetical protein